MTSYKNWKCARCWPPETAARRQIFLPGKLDRLHRSPTFIISQHHGFLLLFKAQTTHKRFNRTYSPPLSSFHCRFFVPETSHGLCQPLTGHWDGFGQTPQFPRPPNGGATERTAPGASRLYHLDSDSSPHYETSRELTSIFLSVSAKNAL